MKLVGCVGVTKSFVMEAYESGNANSEVLPDFPPTDFSRLRKASDDLFTCIVNDGKPASQLRNNE